MTKNKRSKSFANDGRHTHNTNSPQTNVTMTHSMPSSSSPSITGDKPQSKSSRRWKSRKPSRCMSLPTTAKETIGIMKCRTLDESLSSHYGKQSSHRAMSLPANIQFDKIIIREYARTVGDNPSCSSGPPVTISWEYNSARPIPLDDYEDGRPPRRTTYEMVLPRAIRQSMLKADWGVQQHQIARSVRKIVRVKNQRRSTVNNLGKATRVEEVWESFCRKLKRILTLQKPVSAQVEDLESQIDQVQKQRAQQRLSIMMAEEYEEAKQDHGDSEESVEDNSSSNMNDDGGDNNDRNATSVIVIEGYEHEAAVLPETAPQQLSSRR